MTKQEDDQRVKRGPRSQTYEERFPRYAANALTEASFAQGRAAATRRASVFARSAADHARRQGDLKAAELYSDLAEAQEDVADGWDEVRDLENEIATHYGAQVQA